MASGYYLGKDIFLCQIDAVIVVLDARENRYLSFMGDQSRWFSEIRTARQPDVLSQKAATFAQRLLQKGILETDPAKGKPIENCAPSPPRTSVLDDPSLEQRPLHVTEVIFFAYAVLSSWIVWRMQHHRVDRLLATAARWKRRIASSPPASIKKVIQRTLAFHALTPYLLTTHDACFFRSLCLVRYLSLFRLDCDMVFGVRATPFGAHCWVEYDGVVLNDYRDNARGYAKILSA